MAISKTNLSGIIHLRNGLRSMTLRLKSTADTTTPTSLMQSGETRPKQPQNPFVRFKSDRQSKILSELHKEATKRWTGMSEEAKRPYMDNYETAMERWRAERSLMMAQLEAMEEEGKRSEEEKITYTGLHLLYSEVKIPGATASEFMTKAKKMWNDLTKEGKEAYHERARKINEKGQADLLAATMKKIKSPTSGRPLSASMQFRNQFLSVGLKEAFKEFSREWSELSDEEREKYVKQFEQETKLYNAQMEEYRAGETYAGTKRNVTVIKANIKKIEKELNKPKFMAPRTYQLFMLYDKKSYKGKNISEWTKLASEMWEALTEEEQMEYKEKWSKLKADWQTDVAEWEERNADNPKMTELRGYKEMLETSKKARSF